MSEMDDLKKIYESVSIPKELSETVSHLITENSREIYMNNQNTTEKTESSTTVRKKSTASRTAIGVAAAFAVLFGSFAVGVTTNESFAASVSDVPVLGSLARVLTGEQVNEADNLVHIEMALPKVEGLTDKAVEERINQEIHDKMTAVVEESKVRAKENKEAWLATGGKEADYTPVDIMVNYEVKSIAKDILSFVVYKTETSASAYFEMYYYNLDLNTNDSVTLDQLLGADYVELANRQITAEIAERSKDENNLYFDGKDGVDGFSTIAKNQNFYVNQAGNPVIVFNKYEIAPGYMGIQEFEIVK